MKLSQAFATLRAEVVAGLQHRIATELLPQFNSEVENIRRNFEAKKPESEALAMHYRRAAIADLVVRRDAFISDLNTEMRLALNARVKLPEYDGKIEEVDDKPKDGTKGTPRKVLEVTFKDGTKARMPKSLWVDYKAFARV